MVYLRAPWAIAVLLFAPPLTSASSPAAVADDARPLQDEADDEVESGGSFGTATAQPMQRQRRPGSAPLQFVEEHHRHKIEVIAGAASGSSLASGVAVARQILQERLAKIRLLRREGGATENEHRRTYEIKVLPGKVGPPGGPGKKGAPGNVGWRGPQGQHGEYGIHGAEGMHGFNGVQGASGAEIDGDNGDDPSADPAVASHLGYVTAGNFAAAAMVCMALSLMVFVLGYCCTVPKKQKMEPSDAEIAERKRRRQSKAAKAAVEAERQQAAEAAAAAAAEKRRAEQDRAAADNRRDLDQSTAWGAAQDDDEDLDFDH